MHAIDRSLLAHVTGGASRARSSTSSALSTGLMTLQTELDSLRYQNRGTDQTALYAAMALMLCRR
jgi:hypothetical protein